ncbi:hypothetical protein SAMN06297387_10799 [Streptomyces zhaozhouensis]|uniref:Uncharacterized protein n=1 Tax=Streptomyces zhaozhouensis TaxID=1300267 RepID=A0A286DVM6_9ACTN|nr:hypothetical protein [Streptomyces zhaozhouensis]SOD62725.1 hypothetical protein SAMN06297387_10799 [Streptomyces zhaozhouensis]
MGTGPSDQEEPRGGDDTPREEDWDNLVLDESFIRGAEVREPTARTRMLRERWKDGGPAPQPWRSDEPPAGWVHGSGRKKGSRKKSGDKPRKRRWFRRKGKDGDGDA